MRRNRRWEEEDAKGFNDPRRHRSLTNNRRRKDSAAIIRAINCSKIWGEFICLVRCNIFSRSLLKTKHTPISRYSASANKVFSRFNILSVFALAENPGAFSLKNPGFSANADWLNVCDPGSLGPKSLALELSITFLVASQLLLSCSCYFLSSSPKVIHCPKVNHRIFSAGFYLT